MARTWSAPPVVAASAGALIRDPSGRLLILKPTYKSGWTLPGGVMEADGETPWEACRREVFEETGLTVSSGWLACVDTRPAKPGRPLGLRFLFRCEVREADPHAAIRLQASEIERHRFVRERTALDLLRPAVRRRVRSVLDDPGRCRYLEDGRPVDDVPGPPG